MRQVIDMPAANSQKLMISQGVRDAIPIILAYFPISMTFGILSISKGISWPISVLMSLSIYAGASQFMFISLISSGATPVSMTITLLLVNLRHFLYGTTLGPAFVSWPERIKWLSAFGLTDEVFAVTSIRTLENPPYPRYQFALVISCYTSWVSGTIAGVLIGQSLPVSISNILQFALPALFLSLLFLSYRKWAHIIAAAFGAIITITASLLGSGSIGIVSGVVIGSVAGALCKKCFSK